MMRLEQFDRWFLGLVCAVEGLFFGYLAYSLFGFDTMFYGRYVSGDSLFFAFMAVAYVYSTMAIFRSRPRAYRLCVFLFVGTIAWLTLDAFRSYPPAWSELVWTVLLLLAVSQLLYGWMKRGSWKLRPTS